jgi:hypothetical protein
VIFRSARGVAGGERFDEVLEAVESAAGWRTDRIQRPVLILGQMDGILTEISSAPPDAAAGDGSDQRAAGSHAGRDLRIKAWLLATRNTVRDYLDTVVLCERLGDDGVSAALRAFDEIYSQPTGNSALAEVAENDWMHLVARGRHWAQRVARTVLEG